MWLLENLAKELFQDSIEYALDIDFSDSLIFILCFIAILIWILSAVYHTIKGVYKELKKFSNYQLTKKRPNIRKSK